MNTVYDGMDEVNYTTREERQMISECLKNMGLPFMAERALDPSTSQKIIDGFLYTIRKQANVLKRHDVIEPLYFAALIYG